MTLSFGGWVNDWVAEQDLSGYARERVEQELLHDPTLSVLWEAQSAADDRRSRLWSQEGEETEAGTALRGVDRTCGEALEELAEEVAAEAVREEVGGHSVDLRHAMRLDQCPACEEEGVDAYYLGSSDAGEGWVCGHCATDLLQSLPEGDLSVIDGGAAVIEPEGSE